MGTTDWDPATPRQGSHQNTDSLSKSLNIKGIVVVIYFCDDAKPGDLGSIPGPT